EASRTAKIRVPLGNPDGVLKPGMYAEVVLDVDLGERLVVPVEAVIFAGESRIVFEDLGDGLLAPRRIQTGLQNTDYIEVLDGLKAGARIVTSGTFLIASESRLSSGLDQW
ncbi:MAG: efflux RND transporter periplasmic adaptor subunit, partial [Gammaproteobacteria bacterium]|nr:efflux RND transporter periplasmic adaptor subunit [Gammaproteobacteria bacterium]